MSVALNNVTTSDNYTAGNTLACPAAAVVNVQINNAAVYLQFGIGQPATQWDPEEFTAPMLASLSRRCDAVRVKSAVAGSPARVTITAKTAEEAGG